MRRDGFLRVLFLGACLYLTQAAGGLACGKIVYWTEDFEAYPVDETIHQKGTSWTAGHSNWAGWDGYVKVPPGESDQALQLRAPADGQGAVIWWNDTGLKPTGAQELWLSFKPPEVFNFSIEIFGEDAMGDEHVVAYLAHRPAGSQNSLDFFDGPSNSWKSTNMPIMGEQWNTLGVSIDFDSEQDSFGLKLNGHTGSVGLTTEFTYGSPDCFTLRKIVLHSDHTTMYFDDFAWVPEPATVLLLSLGGLFLRRRRLRAAAGHCMPARS